MSSDKVVGLTVRVRDGRALGVAVGVFAKEPLAGQLRVQGDCYWLEDRWPPRRR